jgi:acetyltransferase-like isoleucine patch superfamily enzyme
MMISLVRRAYYAAINQFNRCILRMHGVRYGSNVVINGRIHIKNAGTIDIGDNVIINSGARFSPIGGQNNTRLIAYPGAVIRIHDGVGISNSSIVAQSQIEIGPHAMIGGSCNIWDTDFHSMDAAIRGTSADRGVSAPVVIGEHAFVGAHSILLKGSTIGARAIVGAASVGSLKVAADQVFVRR